MLRRSNARNLLVIGAQLLFWATIIPQPLEAVGTVRGIEEKHELLVDGNVVAKRNRVGMLMFEEKDVQWKRIIEGTHATDEDKSNMQNGGKGAEEMEGLEEAGGVASTPRKCRMHCSAIPAGHQNEKQKSPPPPER